MNEKTFIILFKDCTMQLFSRRQKAIDFQEGATIWECRDTMPIIEICEWFATGNRESRFITKTEWEK